MQEQYQIIKNNEDPDVVVSVNQQVQKIQKDELKKPDSIILQTLSYSVSVLLMALHLSANSKLITGASPVGAAAASITSTVQTIILGTATGCVLSTGIEVGKLIGAKEYEKAGHTSRSAWVLTLILSAICTTLLLTSPWTLPLIFDSEPAGESAKFFLGYAIGNLPTMFIMTSPQIAFQAGDWWVPSVTAALDYFPAFVFSYFLKDKFGLFGIGLGGSLGAWLAVFLPHLRFLHNRYQPLNLFSRKINDLRKNLGELFDSGWKLALQRWTEWGNLFLITLVVGQWNSEHLKSVNASIQSLVVLNLFSQGIAHAAGMLVSRNRGQLPKLNDNAAIEDNFAKIKKVVTSCAVLGLVINGLCAGAAIYFRNSLSQFFLGDSADENMISKTAMLLTINVISLIPDSQRIILMGSIRGWNDAVWPSLASLIVMSAAGISVGYGVGKSFEDVNLVFVTRAASILVTAGIILLRQMGQFEADKQQYKADHEPSLMGRFSQLFMCCSGRGTTTKDGAAYTAINNATDEKTSNGYTSALVRANGH